MQIDNFFSLYATEAECKQYFKEEREAAGIICRKCKGSHHYWISSVSRWQCKKCRSAISLKCGTVMENSNLPYKKWLWAIYFMSLTKKGFFALKMQRLLRHKRYEPIWCLMHKLRISMGNRDAHYKLNDFVEMDEGFFAGIRKKNTTESLEVKPVKELDRQVKVIVAVSSTPIPAHLHKKGKPKTKPGYLKMNVVEALAKVDISYEAQKMVSKTAEVITDGKTSYRVLKEFTKKHTAIIVEDKAKVATVLPWVHIAISNAKKKILGLHHHVNNRYMQNYLNEFCFKFNRRNFGVGLFNRLVISAISGAWFSTAANSG